MTETTSDQISDIIFQRSRENELQFETLFGGLLASLVGLTLPTGIQGAGITFAAVALFVISVVRWLSHTGRFSDEDWIVSATVRPVELCAIVCVIHILTVVANYLPATLVAKRIETTVLLSVGAVLPPSLTSSFNPPISHLTYPLRGYEIQM